MNSGLIVLPKFTNTRWFMLSSRCMQFVNLLTTVLG
jgi:hypothetical protein